MTQPETLHNDSRQGLHQKLEGGKELVLHTEFTPAGDQPTAIAELVEGLKDNEQNQVLLGATGTGKTFHDCQSYRSNTKTSNNT